MGFREDETPTGMSKYVGKTGALAVFTVFLHVPRFTEDPRGERTSCSLETILEWLKY
jgi:hypothetical protein